MSNARPYVVLGIDKELFALDVACVHEILDLCPITRIPNAPPAFLGMIDVRKRMVPVVDLRVKLGLPAIQATTASRIIVLDVVVGGGQRVIGLLSDRVCDVANLIDNGIEEAPDLGMRWKSKFIAGIGRLNGAFVIILDIAELFGSDETLLLEDAVPEAV